MDGTVHLQDLNKEVQDWVNSKSAEIEHLKKLEKYRRDFVGNVSHELKTPIFNVQGYVLTLLDGGLEDETINRKYLLRTEKSIERLINIVTDLETIYKLESDKLVLKQERFDIVPVIRDALETLDSKAKKRGNTLKMNISPEKTVIVYADPGRISQVILNLVANSIAYGNENGVTQIGFFDLDDNILIEVTDNGIGISETEIPRIFERFYRTDSSRSRKSGGTGIGLAIVKHILEAHNQTINVRSELGEGSTFSFMLPKNQKS
ncbi:MAG: sensor histidine kinase [Bacteroidetes bacterium]|nr:sensor histidine kinase [Bacteroidota bacterium]MBU1717914.1 sensor histidine kinase [Bacteroidota bacterium]